MAGATERNAALADSARCFTEYGFVPRVLPTRFPRTHVERRAADDETDAFAAIVAYQRGLKYVVAGVCETDFSGYPDCRPAFVEAFEAMANLATRAGVEGDPFRFETPLLHMTKADISREAHRLGVPSRAESETLDQYRARVRAAVIHESLQKMARQRQGR